MSSPSVRVRSVASWSAAVGTLRDSKDSWPEQLRLDGFAYAHVEGEGVSGSDRIAWLGRHVDTDGTPVFSPRPYEQLAIGYRAMGEDRVARKVGIARQQAHRRHLSGRPRDWPRRVWSLFLGATVGHGYRPWQALVWLVGLWALSAGVVVAAHADGFVRELAAATAPDPRFSAVLLRLGCTRPRG